MNKNIITLTLMTLGFVMSAQAVQVIYTPPRNASNQDYMYYNQLNMQSEQQELLRRQVQIQEEQLRIQRQQANRTNMRWGY